MRFILQFTLLTCLVVSGCHDSKRSTDHHGVLFSASQSLYTKEIYRTNIDGSGLRRVSHELTEFEGIERYKVSPNGRYVAYQIQDFSGSNLNPRLFLARLDKTNVIQIFPFQDTPVWIEHFAWSPDGVKLAFVGTKENSEDGYGLFLFDVKTNQLTDLAPSSKVYNFAWSPTGEDIAFQGERLGSPNSFGLYVRSLFEATDYLVSVNNTAFFIMYANAYSWSPSGQHISYLVGGFEGINQIYVVRQNGSENTKIASDALGPMWWSWSPDGKRIAYQEYLVSFNQNHFSTANPDGSDTAKLTDYEVLGFEWSPDSEKIWFNELFSTGPDTFSTRQVITDIYGDTPIDIVDPSVEPSFLHYANWSPDSSRLLVPGFDNNSTLLLFSEDGVQLAKFANDHYAPTQTNSEARIWRRDSSQFLYHTLDLPQDTYARIAIMLADKEGSGQRELTMGVPIYQQNNDSKYYFWSHDERHIVYMKKNAITERAELYSVRVDGLAEPEKLSSSLKLSGLASEKYPIHVY